MPVVIAYIVETIGKGNGSMSRILDFGDRNRRQAQSQSALSGQQKAAHQMQMKTLVQGQQMVYKYIAEMIEGRTSERWRLLGRLFCPKWYFVAWYGLLKGMLWTTQQLWFVLSWVGLFPLLKRASQVCMRGGHVAKVSQTEHQWTVRIKLMRWWKLVYMCDFDVRNGRVSEVTQEHNITAGGPAKP